ncbi:MAG: hypothetical protein WD598_04805 [Acidimicrobiia bacterium]
MTFTSNDDRPHSGVVDEGWVETWGFELARADGLRGLARLTLIPANRSCWWWTYFVSHELGIVIVRDEEVSLPRRAESMEVRGDGLWAELVCEAPFEHWGISLEAFGLRVDEPEDDVGERLPVGLDVEWEFQAEAESVDVAGGTRYVQNGTMHGEVLIGDDRIEYEGSCVRDHAWGRIELPTWPSRLTD